MHCSTFEQVRIAWWCVCTSYMRSARAPAGCGWWCAARQAQTLYITSFMADHPGRAAKYIHPTETVKHWRQAVILYRHREHAASAEHGAAVAAAAGRRRCTRTPKACAPWSTAVGWPTGATCTPTFLRHSVSVPASDFVTAAQYLEQVHLCLHLESSSDDEREGGALQQSDHPPAGTNPQVGPRKQRAGDRDDTSHPC